MGFFENIMNDFTKPRAKFRKGDKVEHKLNNNLYIIINVKQEEDLSFKYLCSDGTTKIILDEAMIKRHFERNKSNF